MKFWGYGYVGAKAIQLKGNVSLEVPDAGDFERNQPFSVGAWVLAPPKAVGKAAGKPALAK